MSNIDMEALWKPFTPNKLFKKNPRLFKEGYGTFYTSHDDRQILDGISGLWCCNLGNDNQKVIDAISNQAKTMYYSPSFQIGHPLEFELANELIKITPSHLNKVFFSNSGSEGVESALKIALAYHASKGNGEKHIIIGRKDGYHGVNFGGISVGGLVNNKRQFNNLIKTYHIPSVLDISKNAFSKGIPKFGEQKANALQELIDTHGSDKIAAFICEPIAGSGGVQIPPLNYLNKIQKICKDNDILFILDEVITAFGRIGANFGADLFDLKPDIIVLAKGLTAGAVPMGATVCTDKIYDEVVNNSKTPIELFHGYTYSGHPVACAAAIATLKVYKEDKLFDRVKSIENFWQEQIHSLRDCANVIDIRNLGLLGAIELKSINGAVGKRGNEAFLKAFEKNLLIRVTGDIIALSPAFIISKENIAKIFKILKQVLNSIK